MAGEPVGKIKNQVSLRHIMQSAMLALVFLKLTTPSGRLVRSRNADRRKKAVSFV